MLGGPPGAVGWVPMFSIASYASPSIHTREKYTPLGGIALFFGQARLAVGKPSLPAQLFAANHLTAKAVRPAEQPGSLPHASLLQ